MSRHIENLNEGNFEEVALQSGRPVLVDFWAPWCAPCRALTPVLEKLAEEFGDQVVIAKVNVDEQPAIANAAQVQAIPTIMILKDGKLVELMQGLRPLAELRERLRANMTASEGGQDAAQGAEAST